MRNSRAKSVRWFKELLGIMQESGPVRIDSFHGKLFLLAYDPKTKDKLPYYDIFPLVFPVEVESDGFLGINLHYLDPRLRKELFDSLILFGISAGAGEQIYLNFRYKHFNSFVARPLVEVCLKKYLFSHIHSWTNIRPTEWENVVEMPLQSFQKRTSSSVWRTSRRKMNHNGQ